MSKETTPVLKLNAQARMFVPKSKATTTGPSADEESKTTAPANALSPTPLPTKSLNVGAREFIPKTKSVAQIPPSPPVVPQYYPSYPPYMMYAPVPHPEPGAKSETLRSPVRKEEQKTAPPPPKVEPVAEKLVKEVKETLKVSPTSKPDKAIKGKPEPVKEESIKKPEATTAPSTPLDKKPGKVYQVAYLLQFRSKCQKKPKDMRAIEIPLKSNVNIKFQPYEEVQRSETAEAVRNLRILLNKLAKDNFARISDSILNNFAYNEEILQELAHILFNKCVKEHTYIDVYMHLVDQLFHKFRVPLQPKDGQKAGSALNFKKMFISKCQSTFEEKSPDDFLKELPGDLDEEEKKQKKRQRMFGNTKLIGQLFIRGAVPDFVVKSCFERLFKDPKEENIENLCHLLLTIGKKIYEKFALDAQQTTSVKKSKIRLKLINKEIFDDYVDRLIALKQKDGLSSRIKFMIQDVIDARNDDWNNAFDKFPVPTHPGQPYETKGIAAYRKKTKSIEKPDLPIPPMPEPKVETLPDPKLELRELRKKSMNEQNIFGRNIEKFQKTEIEERVRMRLHNAVDEYLAAPILEDVADTINEVIDNEKLPKCICVGHFILRGFSINPKEFVKVYKLVIDLSKQKHVDPIDVEEGIMVALANFYDTLIDNPNSPLLFKEMLDAFKSEKLISEELSQNAMAHIENIKKQLDSEYA